MLRRLLIFRFSLTAKVKLLDKEHLEIAGCIGPGLCKGYVWERADGVDLDLMPGTTVMKQSELATNFKTSSDR